MRKTAATLALAAALWTGCTSGQAPDGGGWTAVAPAPLPPGQNVLNPGRGFFTTDVDLFHPDAEVYASVRARGHTLAYPYETWLPADRDLTEGELATLQHGFDLVRTSGFKLILRFRYSENGDADWGRIQRHLEQLLPIVRRNADVIAVMQAGFLGRWGEWHCWEATEVCHEGAAEKAYVLERLLDALAGTDVPVAVRYPADKARYLGDVDFSGDGDAPPPPDPVSGFADELPAARRKRARIAHLNDCFLSSANDVGTYPNHPPERIAEWRGFTYAENAFLVFGGETCEAEDRDDPARARGARALAELERAHLDYLNADYHPGMLDRWRQDRIYDEVAARMGYRLVVEEAAWTAPAAGEGWKFRMSVRNDGFSRLKRRYDVALVLRQGDRTVERPLGFDLRRVAPGERLTFAAEGLTAPPAGAWRLGVAVRDPALPDRAEYAIRFANDLDYDGVNWLGRLEVR
ncbi:putative secreted protein [Oceanithermus profundus DSM 14977]|uniref:Putative secreted protein n=1 Tax=Oceanithermus profundus (strain DSM 14977 / NBRC 100410 / VKM B-2274 / 506) TaxID=670487 RepID=E4U628_OCEP5|nr:DUF4832 domain-containing protein [Oceanithermus profundus]ADR35849.1 putative secreted protein [Oceanithermus profundus DSM 14977]